MHFMGGASGESFLWIGVIDSMHAPHRSVSVVNDNIESNRHNPLLTSLSIEQIFELLDECTSIPEIIRLVNNVGEDDTYDGCADPKFFEVKHICNGYTCTVSLNMGAYVPLT